MKKKYVAILCVICIVCGFYAGRKTITYKTEIKYVQGEAVRDTVFFPVPVLEVYRDTIFLIEKDMAKTLIDWNTERHYAEQLLDDNHGILDFSATIQFNRLQSLSYSLTPIYRETTKYKIEVWQPYAGVSFNTLNQATFSVGTFRKKIAFELQYISDFERKKQGWGIGFKYKF